MSDEIDTPLTADELGLLRRLDGGPPYATFRMSEHVHTMAIRAVREIERNRAEIATLKVNQDYAAERIVCMMSLYGAYTINSRGPSGCMIEALDRLAPDIATKLRDGDDAITIHTERWDDETAP